MINNVEKYHPYIYGILGIFSFMIFVLQRISGLSLKISTATPVLLLPLVIVIACFLKEWVGFWFGFASGVMLDIFMADSRIFNTIAFIVIGLGAGLLFHYLFNRNIKAVVLGGLAVCFVYFFFKWLFLSVFMGDPSAFKILFKYEIPSAIYSSVFLIPFFFLVRNLCKKYIIQK